MLKTATSARSNLYNCLEQTKSSLTRPMATQKLGVLIASVAPQNRQIYHTFFSQQLLHSAVRVITSILPLEMEEKIRRSSTPQENLLMIFGYEFGFAC